MSYPTKEQAAQAIKEIGRCLYEKNMVAANDGNISIKIGENRVMITASGVSKGFITNDHLVITDMQGNILEGTSKPSSELAMHLKVYSEREDVNSVVHAHPVFSTAFAAAEIPLIKPILTESVIGIGEIPIAPFAVPGTKEVPESIEPFIRQYNGCLLAHHGALAWGKNAEQAFHRLEAIEHTAKIRAVTEFVLNKDASLSAENLKKLAPFVGRFD